MDRLYLYHSIEGPKLRGFCKELSCDEAEGLGILCLLWIWAVRYNNADKNGRLLYVDDNDIISALSGKTTIPCNKVVEALFKIGWLDRKSDGIYIHDWGEWQKQIYKDAEKKKNDNERKKNEKKESAPISNGTTEEPKYSEDFERFWKSYPRHDQKEGAYKCFKTRLKDGWSEEQLVEAAQNYSAECVRNATDKKYIKLGQTFLSSTQPFRAYIKRFAVKKENGNPFDDEGR